MSDSARPLRAVMAVLAWMGAGILAINAVAVSSAAAEAVAPTGGGHKPAPKELAVQLPVERDPGPTKGKGRVIEVDKPEAGKAHHPLYLYADSFDVNGTPLVASATPNGYTPAQIKGYLGLTGTGYGVTIAIVVAYNHPNIAADLATFDTAFGLPAPASFKKISQTGSTSLLPAPDENWALEASLDVEWAHALAPKAGILLVEANSSSLSDLGTAISYAAKSSAVTVISNSWGTTGDFDGEIVNDYRCKQTAKLCVFASGDLGNPGGYPAYSPYVLSVGGTSLNLQTDPTTGAVTVASESAWSGSGGGVSLYEPKPAYQTANTTGFRGIPDVSFAADPSTGFAVYDSYPYQGSSGWYQMGGTSAGAPQWSAIIAAADQLRKAKRKTYLVAYNTRTYTYPAATAFYTLTAGLADITDGPANGNCDLCNPAVGYDFVTGLGSPRAGIDVALAAAP